MPPTTTRERILTAARAVFLEEGVDGLTMRAVAQRADIGTMTTYRHFDGRDTLLAALVVEGFTRFQAYFYRALEAPDPASRLWACAEQYLAFALDHPRDYALMFHHPRPLGELPLDRAARRQIRAARQFLVDRLQELRPADATTAQADALRVWAVCHGAVSLHLAHRLEVDVDFPAFYRDTVRAALRGIGAEVPVTPAPPSPPPPGTAAPRTPDR